MLENTLWIITIICTRKTLYGITSVQNIALLAHMISWQQLQSNFPTRGNRFSFRLIYFLIQQFCSICLSSVILYSINWQLAMTSFHFIRRCTNWKHLLRKYNNSFIYFICYWYYSFLYLILLSSIIVIRASKTVLKFEYRHLLFKV